MMRDAEGSKLSTRATKNSTNAITMHDMRVPTSPVEGEAFRAGAPPIGIDFLRR